MPTGAAYCKHNACDSYHTGGVRDSTPTTTTPRLPRQRRPRRVAERCDREPIAMLARQQIAHQHHCPGAATDQQADSDQHERVAGKAQRHQDRGVHHHDVAGSSRAMRVGGELRITHTSRTAGAPILPRSSGADAEWSVGGRLEDRRLDRRVRIGSCRSVAAHATKEGVTTRIVTVAPIAIRPDRRRVHQTSRSGRAGEIDQVLMSTSNASLNAAVYSSSVSVRPSANQSASDNRSRPSMSSWLAQLTG